MNIPCAQVIDCPGDDSPIRNLSAEDPDVQLFCTTAFFRGIPPIGVCWEKLGCATPICSTESLEEAEIAADIAARDCVWDTWSTPGCTNENAVPPTIPPPEEPPRTPVVVFTNTAQQCTAYCPDGIGFTYTVAAGRYNGLSQAAADAEALSAACELAQIHRVCLSSITSPCCADTAYVQVITGTSAFRSAGDFWALISGSLPPGLTFTGGAITSALISGTPTTAGTYTFTIRLTLTNGDLVQKTYSLRVVQITTVTITAPTVGVPYSFFMTQSGGQNAVWSVVAGTLAPGLALVPTTGEIYGTATGPFPGNITFGLYSE